MITKLHWTRTDEGFSTEEQRAGVPDFKIQRHPAGWFAKMRSSRQWTGPFDTAAEAKTYCESV